MAESTMEYLLCHGHSVYISTPVCLVGCTWTAGRSDDLYIMFESVRSRRIDALYYYYSKCSHANSMLYL